MFECLQKVAGFFAIQPYTSSTGHRNAQRVNAGSEIISTSLAEFTPAAIIPTKMAQILTSGYSMFRTDTHGPERLIHFLEMGISCAQVGLAINLLTRGDNCTTPDSDICKAIFLTQLLYKGILLAGWVPSEFAKDPYVPPVPPQVLGV
jgi:hypothetical protein